MDFVISFQLVPLFFEIGIALTALVFSISILYLALFKIKSSAVKVYNHMVIMSTSVDVLFSSANLLFLPVRHLYCNNFSLTN